jgi:hypothetical protein
MWREHGLTFVLMGLFVVTLFGQIYTGWKDYNEEQRQHDGAPIGLGGYLGTGHFGEATFENWESEFLQMSAYVLLTVFLFQKGSAESKPPDRKVEVDADPRHAEHPESAPWPVRRGGLALVLYEYSLTLAFAALFLASFALHAALGIGQYNSVRLDHGEPAQSVVEYMTSWRFWFESFQNWQSEFLSLAAMVVLSIFLRQRGSPESKPVAAPTWETEG